VRAGAAVIALLLAFVPAARAASDDPFYGVVIQQAASSQEFELMRAGGVGTVRFVLPWTVVQRQRGAAFRWSLPDRTVTSAAESGIQATPFLYGTPAWAQRCPWSDAHKCIHRAPIASPAAMNGWKRFVTAAVARYGPGGQFWAENPSLPYEPITAWQIWNEPNLPVYWEPKPSVGGYAKLLALSRDAIRAVDPDAEIVLGGMNGDGGGSRHAVTAWSYLTKLYRERGARSLFDAAAIHPYDPGATGAIGEVKRLRSVIATHHDSAGLWVSEIGWSSDNKGLTNSAGLVGQAQRLKAAYDSLVDRRNAWNLERVYWYAWRDTPRSGSAICAWCGSSGLLSSSGVPKPAWAMFQHFSLGLPIPPDLFG
jgi:polysaccharide biosynthesis protein PslG